MLIRFLILLVAANLAWFFWAHGWRSGTPQNEPERLAQQMRPETVQLREAAPDDEPPPAAAAEPPVLPPAVIVTRAPEPAPEPAPQPDAPAAAAAQPQQAPPQPRPRTACLQAGAFGERQIEAVRQRAAQLPAGSWSVQEVALPDRWMIFLPAPDELALVARRAELRAQGIDTDRPSGAQHGLGLSLGRYTSEERAQRGLEQLAARGVRDARVVTERQSARAWTLRLPNATPELRERAERTLGSALAGHDFQECSANN